MPRRRRGARSQDDLAIAKRLRELRKSRGLSQMELAEQVGVDQTHLSAYERGKIRLHGAMAVSLAKALRTSTDQLLGLKASTNGVVHDRRFLRRLERIEVLPRRAKQTLLRMIDMYLDHSEKR